MLDADDVKHRTTTRRAMRVRIDADRRPAGRAHHVRRRANVTVAVDEVGVVRPTLALPTRVHRDTHWLTCLKPGEA
jgi:ribosomal protein L32E